MNNNCIIKWKIILERGLIYMKEIQIESREFKRILQNLQLENLTLHPRLQKKVVELVNSGVNITPSIIKDTLKYGKV